MKVLPPVWKRRGSLLMSLAVAMLLAGVARAHAQDRTAEIDEIFGRVTASTPGCACAVSRNGKVVASRGYGLADLERNVPITPETIFDIGSVQKQFVAASILMLVEEGRLSLTEDVHRYVPELPDYGHRITLDHLLTHTSGIRDWTGLGPLTGRNVDALTLTLRQRALNFAPGEEWSYSNSGYVLLKEIITRTSGMPVGDFMRQRIFEPLGMKSSSYRPDLRDVVKNRALAYEKDVAGWKLDILLDNARGGGGGMLSTAGDLLLWNDALTSGRFGAFVTAKLQEPAKLNNGRRLGYARGLMLADDPADKAIYHGGGSGAYSTALARYPNQNLSLAVLCNGGESMGSSADFARRIFDVFSPPSEAEKAEAAARAAPARVEGLDVESRAGLFFSEPAGEPLRLSAEKGRLRVEGGPPLDAVTKDHFRNARGALFVMSQDQFELRFVSADQLELKSMEGRTTRYRRARPWTPGASDLQAYAGRYVSEEVGFDLRIAAGAGGLEVQTQHAPEWSFTFRPVERDVFQLRGMIVRFERDQGGNVVGLDYRNPVVRHVQYRRQSDHTSSR